MSYRIDDDENRIQDLKDQIDQLEVQTFSPEVVARNESTRNTGIETGDSAALNPYPMWIPIRDFGDVGLVTQEIVLNRVDSHIAKMTITGDVDFAFSLPPPTNKMMWFILDTTIDNVGGFTINLLENILPAGITIDNTANARTVIRFTTTDGGATYFAEDLTTGGGAVGGQTPWLQQIEGAGFILNEAGKIVIKPIQTDGLEGVLDLVRNDTTPSNNDSLGVVFFKGPDSGATIQTWASIEATYKEVTAGAKQTQFTIRAQKDNSLLPIIDYTGDDATFKFSSGVDVVRPNANGSKELGTSSFFWDDVFTETLTFRGSGANTTGTDRTIYADAAGMVFNMPSTAAAFTHSIENEIFSLLTNGDLELRTELPTGFDLRLRNNDQTPSVEDAATILFNGNDENTIERTFGSIRVTMTDIGDTTKQSDMSFRAMANNSFSPWMTYIGVDDKINLFADFDMNFRDILDMGGETINAITIESVVDQSNDFLMFFDASVAALRKINFASLPPGGGDFLPLDGSSAMTGNLDMGGTNDIVNADDILFTDGQSIITGSGIFTLQFDNASTWRLRKGTTSMIIANDTGIQFSGSVGIGFFGTTPIAQEIVASDTLANLYTALRNYGLIA